MILPARRGRDETVSFLFLNQGPEDLAELFGWVGIQSQHVVLRVVFHSDCCQEKLPCSL